MISQDRLDRAGVVIVVAIVVAYLALAAVANADLTAHRSFLFMDELITFDGVRAILHPAGKRAFLLAVLDGGDQRYGRILWNASALVAFIPERIAGVPAQIFAARELQAVLQAAAYLILAVTFVQRWIWRALLVAVLCAVPFAASYATWVKPEPIQLLCLSLFFWFLKRDGLWKPWSWLFLGLAFGAKISVLPIVAVAFAVALAVQVRQRAATHDTIRSIAKIGLAFVIGWVIAVPTLALIPIHPAYFKGYLGWTFLGTGHGADDTTVGPLAWMQQIVIWWPGPAVLVVVSIVLALAVGAAALWKPREPSDRWKALPWIAGLLLLGPIVLTVKRLWGFYLYPGTVLLLVGSIGSAESLMTAARPHATRWLGRAFILAIGSLAIIWMWPATVNVFEELSQRTRSAEYTSKRAMWDRVNDMLRAESSRRDSLVTAYYDPHLYPPDAGPRVDVKPFWGPFVDWAEGRDVVIMRRELTPEAELPAPTSAEYDVTRRSHELFRLHVAGSGGACREQPCYDPIVDASLPDLRVFRRRSTDDAPAR